MGENRTSTVMAKQAQQNREEREEFDRAVLEVLQQTGRDDVHEGELAEEIPASAFRARIRSAGDVRSGGLRSRVRRIKNTLMRLERQGLVASRVVQLPPRRRGRAGALVTVYGAAEGT